MYWSSVEMMLYLMKHARFDIANETWEMSKVNDEASKAAFLKSHHLIKHALGTKNLWFKISLWEMGKKHGILPVLVTAIMEVVVLYSLTEQYQSLGDQRYIET